MTVQPGSERWKELVQQGIIKDGQRNWFLGDAALEISPMGDDGVRNGALANLRQYAAEIGVEYESLMAYRNTAAKWPASTRVLATCWKVHHQLMGRQELMRPGMTVTQAAAALGQSNVGRTGPKADVANRAAAAKEYLADPEVADEVMRNPEARADVVRAQGRRQERQEQQPRPAPAPTPYDVMTDMNSDLHEIRYRLRAIHDRQGKLRDTDRVAVAESLEVVAGQATLIADVVRDPASVQITDDALQDFLDGSK